MSAEHKRPLYAFAAVMVVCVMIIAHAVHSQALTRFLGPTSPAIVAAGPHFVLSPAVTADPPSSAVGHQGPVEESAAVPAPVTPVDPSSVRAGRHGDVRSTAVRQGRAGKGKQAQSSGKGTQAPGKGKQAPSSGPAASPGSAASAPGHAHSAAATGTPPGRARAADAPGRSVGQGKAHGVNRGPVATKNRSQTGPARGKGAKRPARAVKPGPAARGPRASGRHGRR